MMLYLQYSLERQKKIHLDYLKYAIVGGDSLKESLNKEREYTLSIKKDIEENGWHPTKGTFVIGVCKDSKDEPLIEGNHARHALRMIYDDCKKNNKIMAFPKVVGDEMKFCVAESDESGNLKVDMSQIFLDKIDSSAA